MPKASRKRSRSQKEDDFEDQDLSEPNNSPKAGTHSLRSGTLLDTVLGPLKPGYTLLNIVDGSTLDNACLLHFSYYGSAVEKDYHVVRINTDYPADWLFDRRTTNKMPKNYFSKFFYVDSRPQNFLIDLFVRPEGTKIHAIKDLSIIQVGKPAQPGHFRLAINEIYDRILKQETNPLILWDFDNLSTFTLNLVGKIEDEERTVIQLFNEFSSRIKMNNEIAMVILNRKLHSQKFVAAIQHLADNVINWEVQKCPGHPNTSRFILTPFRSRGQYIQGLEQYAINFETELLIDFYKVSKK
ncbi:MAG: hypothetical protein ACTSYO_04990 [Candidatus Ranarchaeia archaeon]